MNEDPYRPVVITQNGATAGSDSGPAQLESMRNAIGMLKLLAKGEEDARQGKVRPPGGRACPRREAAIAGDRRTLTRAGCPALANLYRVDGRRVYVLAVIDSRRNIEDLLLARLIR